MFPKRYTKKRCPSEDLGQCQTRMSHYDCNCHCCSRCESSGLSKRDRGNSAVLMACSPGLQHSPSLAIVLKSVYDGYLWNSHLPKKLNIWEWLSNTFCIPKIEREMT